MQCDVEWQSPYWDGDASRRHRKGSQQARKLWDRSVITAQTTSKKEPSIYSPYLTETDIREMEMECVREEERKGTEIAQEICHVRRFYRKMGREIGCSEGKKTEYIFVLYNHTGSVHGYPVTADYLKRKRVKL